MVRVVVIGLMAGVMGLGAATLQAGGLTPHHSPFYYSADGKRVSMVFSEAGSRQTAGAFGSMFARFYDTEGKAGMAYSDEGDGFSGRLGLENGTVYTIEGFSCPLVGFLQYQVPFWWETTNPWSGTVRGWGKSSTYGDIPNFLFPAPASEVGFSIHREGKSVDS